MVLDFEYGINTGNRFLDFVDHDEDPEEFIARQAQEEKSKKSAKDSKTVTATTTTKKTTTKPTTTTASTTKTNKENFTGKSTGNDQRRQQTNVLSDNVNQQTRVDSGRGGGRGYPRRGGSTGQDRQPYEGGSRGGNQQRSQRFNKYEGQQQSNETGGFEQSVESWGNETSNDNQTFSGYRGRGRGGGRGRGNYEGGRGGGNYEGGRGRGNYEGGRGGGRGRGGRGNFNNRNFEEGSQQQQTGDSSFDDTRPQTARTPGQELDTDVPAQERPFESGSQRGQGQFRSRTFHNNRGYGGGRQHQYDREGGQDDYRQNRRQHDRQPRSNTSTVKPVEKKDGEGAHNWGSATENFEENAVTDETAETTGQTTAAPKNWSEQVDEAEEQTLLDEQKKQMTLDEYKKQLEEKKRAAQEKVPQLNRRVANEGVDPKQFKEFEQEYRKKNEGEESDEELEEGSGEEENESEEESVGKKKIITIPLHFKPIEMPGSGPFGSRGGARRGSGRFRPNRDDQARSKSPTQQQSASYQQTGEYQNDEQFQQQQQQSRPYRGGPRGSGRGEYRRSYGNSNRGSRGGYNRSNASSNTPDFDNTVDFPTLPKQ